MNIKNMIISLVLASIILLTVSGCQKPIPTPALDTACTTDSDCACGTRINTGECFYGNKAYVNVEKQCPDFCTGIAAMFEIKCIEQICKQVRIQKTDCSADIDCKPATCCHATSCMPGKGQPECAAVLCSAECEPGTIDCGGGCACEYGECVAKLNNLAPEPIPTEKECTTDSDCIPAQCCHPTTCKPGTEQPECAAVSCTAECRAGTMDCGGKCLCQEGKCVAQLNDM